MATKDKPSNVPALKGGRQLAARVPAISPEMIDKIAGGIAAGLTNRDAARQAGLDRVTLWRWMTRGREEPDTIYGDLAVRIEEALVDFKAVRLAHIANAATHKTIRTTTTTGADGKPMTVTEERDPPWQASAWLLERKFPNEFGRFERHEVGKPGEFTGVDPEELAERLARFVNKVRPPDGDAAP